MLARRLFYSFRKPGADALVLGDIARLSVAMSALRRTERQSAHCFSLSPLDSFPRSFPDEDTALVAFAVLDRDENGDASRDEIDMACMQIHREKLSLEASMRDTAGAVGRLNDVSPYLVSWPGDRRRASRLNVMASLDFHRFSWLWSL